MIENIRERFPFEKSLFIILIIALLTVFAIAFYLFFGYSSKKITLVSPNGKEKIGIGQKHTIKWTARGVQGVGIALYDGNQPDKPRWIVQNVKAGQGSYEWELKAGQDYGSSFKIAVFEYPWSKESKVDYSNESFEITFPELTNCDSLSAGKEWPYLPSNTPNLRKLFLTKESFSGNLDGLEGADLKCQQAAEALKYEGKWTAFLGGEKDEDTAVKRLEKTSQGKGGIFAAAEPASELVNKNTCHRLISKNFEELLTKFSALEIINGEKLEKGFMEDLEKAWIGRLNPETKKTCISIESSPYSLKEKYSFTTTCQNWTSGDKLVSGYSEGMRLNSSFPSCYTPKGEFTYSLAVGGLGIGIKDGKFSTFIGKYCDSEQGLICTQD